MSSYDSFIRSFHLIQFFIDAQQRRRRYLGEAKKHHKARFIDRCLARKPEQLTEEERGFVLECPGRFKVIR